MSAQNGCGCQVSQDYDFIEKKNNPVIKYCPMHTIAPELLETLKALLEAMEALTDSEGNKPLWQIEDARSVIRQVEGQV